MCLREKHAQMAFVNFCLVMSWQFIHIENERLPCGVRFLGIEKESTVDSTGDGAMFMGSGPGYLFQCG